LRSYSSKSELFDSIQEYLYSRIPTDFLENNWKDHLIALATLTRQGLLQFPKIDALKRSNSDFYRLLGSFINGITVLIPLIITLKFYRSDRISLSTDITIFTFYFILTIGTILSWWVPYFFGSPKKHKDAFLKFSNTHHFIVPRGDNVIPNTLHVILHLQVWACLAISIYFLFLNS
jgi:hypothetical protein